MIIEGGVAERVASPYCLRPCEEGLWQYRDSRVARLTRPPSWAALSSPSAYRGSQSGSSSVCADQSAGGAPALPAATMPPTIAQVVSTSPPA